MGKGSTKGRYICKVGYLDIYAKDTLDKKKISKYNSQFIFKI